MCVQPQSCDLTETRGAWGVAPRRDVLPRMDTGSVESTGGRWGQHQQSPAGGSISRVLLVQRFSGLQTQATLEVWSAEEEGSNPCNHTEIPR